MKQMTQEERLAYLTEAFIEDAPEYRTAAVPDDNEGRRRLLRSLMNVRMPKTMDPEVLWIQDAYLQERASEKGIVTPDDIAVIRDCISVWQGDITRLKVDAVVNAANSQMLGCFVPMHTCIDNCIHTYAGIQLRAECAEKMKQLRILNGMDYEQPTAVPMLTDAYNLPAEKVIHIVGPIVYDRLTAELENELADCYRNTLDLCASHDLKTVAFCCISTGVFRFPQQRAAEIAVKTVSEWLQKNKDCIERIIFNVFKDEDRMIYEALLQKQNERI